MSLAVCDQEAFYPLRNLVNGPLTDLNQLIEIERFVRTVVLHDEISMEMEPWPCDPDSEREWAEEEQRAGRRNVIVAVGPVLTGYDFFTQRLGVEKQETPDIALSSSMIEVARRFSNANEGNVYFKAHVEYLQRITSIVQQEGSALLAGAFGSAAIDTSSEYPEKLFENLNQDWQRFAQEAHAGDIGFMVPPMLSIILTRCARRDAIPAIIKDLRDEWINARAKVWVLLRKLKTVNTVAEMQEIRQELADASRLMSPAQTEIDTRPVRVLWDLIIGGVTGATTSLFSGGNPSEGAAIGAIAAGARTVPALAYELGPALFGRGAFDLARRVRHATMRVEYDALARLLTDSEKSKLGL